MLARDRQNDAPIALALARLWGSQSANQLPCTSYCNLVGVWRGPKALLWHIRNVFFYFLHLCTYSTRATATSLWIADTRKRKSAPRRSESLPRPGAIVLPRIKQTHEMVLVSFTCRPCKAMASRCLIQACNDVAHLHNHVYPECNDDACNCPEDHPAESPLSTHCHDDDVSLTLCAQMNWSMHTFVGCWKASLRKVHTDREKLVPPGLVAAYCNMEKSRLGRPTADHLIRCQIIWKTNIFRLK